MLQVTFPEIARLLMSLGSVVPAAEAHGCLCGALCISERYTFERWRGELISDEEALAAPADEQPLRLLFSDTVVALGEEAADFAPLLPDDDVALEQRTSALSQWASGFLYGLGTARPSLGGQMSPTVEEVLRDFARIGAAALEADADSEEQEQAYAELLEYLRVGVWLVYAELTAMRATDANAALPDSFS